jgi:hypothetical protein
MEVEKGILNAPFPYTFDGSAATIDGVDLRHRSFARAVTVSPRQPSNL